MVKLLDDYTIDARTRYEAHKLIYTPDGEEPIVLSGFLAAAILGALIVDTDEGEARGVALDTEMQRKDFFERYEREVRRENGGLFTTEVQALNESYLEFTGAEVSLLQICCNERLYDMAIGMTVEYMQRLVREQVGERIYDAIPWEGPFAQWLFDAGHAESRRQYLLSVDWTDAVEVYELSEKLNELQSSESYQSGERMFVFDGLSAEQILNGYWEWLWATAQQEANLYPDANVQMVEIEKSILEHETNYDFLKPEMKDFTPEQLNLFRSWMRQWIDFVQSKIQPVVTRRQKKEEEQIFFPDEVLQCPTEDLPERYAAAREYVKERSKYDEKFRKFVKNVSHAKLCRQLSLLFGWYVDPNSLRKSMLRKPKRKTKKYT